MIFENMEHLEDELQEIFGPNFSLTTGNDGEIIVHTNLMEDSHGDIVALENDLEDGSLDEDDDLNDFDDFDGCED